MAFSDSSSVVAKGRLMRRKGDYDRSIAATPSARIDPHLIIRVSGSSNPEKANFLFARNPSTTHPIVRRELPVQRRISALGRRGSFRGRSIFTHKFYLLLMYTDMNLD